MKKYTIYYDEAGRGPLAGSVFVGLSIKHKDFDDMGFDDSKKVSENKRNELYYKLLKLEKDGFISLGVGSASSSFIDESGIVNGIKLAISKGLIDLFTKLNELPNNIINEKTNNSEKIKYILNNLVEKIILDGDTDFGLGKLVETETIIKGDGKVKMIGISSIIAKKNKDMEMIELNEVEGCDKYGFADNKGYGTKKHIEAIKEHGLTKYHRKSFCKSLK